MSVPDAGVFVVVAAYNESRVIRDVVGQLCAAYAHVVVVDDGSTDGTAERLDGTPAFVIRHAMNRGQGAAIQTGIEFALARGAQIVVTFDGDGQHEVADVGALIAPIAAGECDVALGSRFLGRAVNIPFGRYLMLRAAILFTRVFSGIRVTDVHNGLRALSREAAQSLRITVDRMAHASEVLEQVHHSGWRIREIPVTVHYTGYSRERGQNGWNALSIVAHLIRDRLAR